MSAAGPLCLRVVLDATTADAARRARALTAFIEGLSLTAGAMVGDTVIFCADAGGGHELAGLAPTPDVRLVAAPARRPDLMVEHLLALEGGAPGGARPDLYLTAPGSAGVELATRLACRTGGAALSRVLDLRLAADAVQCRTTLYSGHLTGWFDLDRRPWCLSLDAAWADEHPEPPAEHRVLSDGAETTRPHDAHGAADAGETPAAPPVLHAEPPVVEPFADVELVAPPTAGDLANARFVVVAGYGAGREGVARLAAAARRMGAAFGVSRPVVMSAWAPPDRLLGASGARAAPLVCLVVAASGAPALYWGIEQATFIAAVNTDEHAPIVRNADAVVIGDAVGVIEALAAIVEGERGTGRPEGESERD